MEPIIHVRGEYVFMVLNNFSLLWDIPYHLFLGKLRIWSLSFTLDFKIVLNLSIVSNWSLTFQCRVDLVSAVIYWMEKSDVSNGLNKNK